MAGFEEGVHFTFGFGGSGGGGGEQPQPPRPADAAAPTPSSPRGHGPGGALAWEVHPHPPPDAELTPTDIAGPLLPPGPPLCRALISGTAAAAALAGERKGKESAENSATIASLDLAPGIYEGGFKAWEGGEALARLLAGDARPGAHAWLSGELSDAAQAAVSSPFTARSILELGAGAALPSLVAGRRGAAALDLADFNPSVLEHLTAVNVRAAGLGAPGCAVRFWAGDWRGLPGAMLGGRGESEGGGGAPASPPPWDLILAAEVTYAPEALAPFLECLGQCLREGGIALVAAKRYYFGVGGASRELVAGAEGLGLEAGVVASTDGGRGGGGGEVPIDVVAVRRKGSC